MIYVTSTPIPERVIDYYLSLLPGVIPSHARARLHMVAAGRLPPRRSPTSCSSGRGCSRGSAR